MTRGLFRIFFISLIASLSTGCFTGIESTPKITANDVKKEKVVVTAEQLYLDSIGNMPFSQWRVGKRFYVTDNKINLIFGATANPGDSLAGKVITYNGYATATDITGEQTTDIVFASPEGKEYVYRINASIEELNRRSSIDVPFTIEESLVAQTSQKLIGNKYYVITSVWYDFNDEIAYGRKFIPVKIVDVQPGNHVYPVKLTFEDSNDKKARLFLSVGNGYKSPRSFATLFSFTDPRLKYPEITDNVWNNIINGHVALDMTGDECRLSLGSPKEIDRRPGYSGVRELWVYENGTYLIFEDGLLREFRNANTRRQ